MSLGYKHFELVFTEQMVELEESYVYIYNINTIANFQS